MARTGDHLSVCMCALTSDVCVGAHSYVRAYERVHIRITYFYVARVKGRPLVNMRVQMCASVVRACRGTAVRSNVRICILLDCSFVHMHMWHGLRVWGVRIYRYGH